MINFIKRRFGQNIVINKIESISYVEVLDIHRIIHDRSDWTIIVADVKVELNGIRMILPIHVSIKSKRATRDKWLTIQCFPLEYRGCRLHNDCTSLKTDDKNSYTIPKELIPQLMAYITPFIKECQPQIIYR